MAEHKTLGGANNHEPKNIETAAANTVYVANGSGSGTWTNLTASIKNANLITLCSTFTDISTAESIFIPTPILGTVTKILVTLHGPITVANSTVTAKINGVAVSGSSITITQAGSAGGSTFTSSPTGSNTLSANNAIEIITDGGSSTAVRATVVVWLNVA